MPDQPTAGTTRPLAPDAGRWALDAFPRAAFPGRAGDALRIAYTRGWNERTAYLLREGAEAVMRLDALLRDYRDGDERGWAAEFDFLASKHAAKLDLLSTSVQEVGIQVPILLGNDGRVWDGHHRLAVASKLGIAHVPVRFTPASPVASTREDADLDAARGEALVARYGNGHNSLERAANRHGFRHGFDEGAAWALASRTVETAEEWEYGWVSRFDTGEEYAWDESADRDEIESMMAAMIEAEKDEDPDRALTYSLRRRRILPQVSGPWEPVPPTPDRIDIDDTAYIEHLIESSPDRELARYAWALHIAHQDA